jgi:hypothetical protein
MALAVACGGAATPPSEIREDDLSLMVLQPEDVPLGLRLLEEDGSSDRGLVEPMYDPRAMTMFLRVFEQPRDEAEPGSVACIGSSVLLYETAQDARETFRELEEVQRAFEKQTEESEVESPWSEIDSASLPRLGDELKVIQFAALGTGFCSSYDDEPAEGYVIAFVRRNVAAGLFVYTYERGASLDEAIELAQTQASRIEAVFEGAIRRD